MWKQVDLCQTKPGKKPLILRINSFALFFRLRVNNIGTVHTPRAHTYDNAIEIFQQATKTNFVEEKILRRHMSTRKD